MSVILVYNICNEIVIFFRYGHQVSIGDEVLIKVNDKLSPANVVKVDNLAMQGKFLFKTSDVFCQIFLFVAKLPKH